MDNGSLAKWWASLLDKKIYVAVTFGSTVLLAGAVVFHSVRQNKWDAKELDLMSDLKACHASLERQEKEQKLITSERINELKADRDTAFARLERLAQQRRK